MSDLSSPSPVETGFSLFDVDKAATWFFAQSHELFIVTDEGACIVHVNPAWTEAMGWSPADMIGCSVYDFVHPEDADDLKAAGRTLRQTGAAQAVFRVKTGAGDWRWLSGRSQRVAGGRYMAILHDVTEKRQKAQEVEALRTAQSMVAETAGVATWTIDPITLDFIYSHRASRLSAETKAPAMDNWNSLERLVHADDWPTLSAWYETVSRKGGAGEFTFRFKNSKGSPLHFQVNYRSELHPCGRFTIHGLSQNITAAVRARDAALRAERMTRQMVEEAPFAAAMFDKTLRHLVVSRAWCAILGFDESALVGRALDEIFPKARRRFICAQKRALEGETVRRPEDRLISHDGRLHWVRWQMQPWRDAEGRISGVLAYISDVSALVAARREAQSSARRLKLAVGAARSAVFEIDYVERAVWFRPDFVKLVGRHLTFDEMNGVWPHVHPEDRELIAAAVSAFDSRHPPSLEARVIHPDGCARWVCTHLDVQHDALGRPRKAVGLLMDIDDRKRQELALAAAEHQAKAATEAKSRFLANISHEIRTPMNGVLGVLQLIKRNHLDTEDLQLLEEGLASGRMLTELLDDLLDFSKIETGQFELHPEPLDPAQVLVGVASLLEPAASAKGLTMRAVAEPGLGMINADPLRLRQALYNIMGNAVKFTPSGSVEARLVRCETPDGPRLRFEVQDTGVGVPEAAQTTLFERFEQADGSMSRKFGGSGLGLAITKRLAEKMGGGVGFSSQPGEGSTFWIELDGEECAPVDKDAPEADIGEFRVLLVEDNPTNRMVISKLLQALGITVETAEDGEAGVAAAARGGFDLVLMDIQMPGMDGMEATRRIRALGGPISETPVVAITANVMADQKSGYVAAGMNGVVSKPVSAAALLSEITRVAESRAA